METFSCCVFCGKQLSTAVDPKIGAKAAYNINKCSAERKSGIEVSAGMYVHKSCQASFISKRNIKAAAASTSEEEKPKIKRSSRISQGPFVNQSDCILCGVLIHDRLFHLKDSSGHFYAYKARTDEFAESISEKCKTRSDDWSHLVEGRVQYFMNDLHAADCVYHQSCSVNFRTNRNIPYEYSNEPPRKKCKGGRPKNEERHDAFLKTCEYFLKNDDEQMTLSGLVDYMNKLLIESDQTAYEKKYLKEKLIDHFGDSIVISGDHDSRGADIITMKETADSILRSYYTSKSCETVEEFQNLIIKTAARLIKSDIKANVKSEKDCYPTTADLQLEHATRYLPGSLKMFLNELFVGKDTERKTVSIGQCIIQGTRPRAVMAPLQIGLAVQAHHVFGSEFLNNTLHRMGFASSYAEVRRFQYNAAVVGREDLLGKNPKNVLLAGDNFDHNQITLDGKFGVHIMGMLAALTPKRNDSRLIPRKKLSEIDLGKVSTITIREYVICKNMLREVKFGKLPNLPTTVMKLDTLWKLSWKFQSQRPNWSGFMNAVYDDAMYTHPGPASIVFLPMINMDPTDMSCIYTSLNYLSDLCLKYKVDPIVTFDQPLFWKAAQIINAEKNGSLLKRIVLMLGPFHTFMNLLGAIGTLMGGSGIDKILETVYAENSVQHMLTGKAVSRAFRGHILVDFALSALVLDDIFPNDDDSELDNGLDKAKDLYESVISHLTKADDIGKSNDLSNIGELIDAKTTQLSEKSDTSRLWLNYQKMVLVAKKMLTADRTGSFNGSLEAIEQSLSIFAAAGHHNYFRSAYLFLQIMVNLKKSNPNVYRQFQAGYHVLRRTNRYWAGIGSDLAIEQCLMRSLKTSGGLTRGSGATENMISLWTLSVPLSSEYNLAMQDFSGVKSIRSEQHKELGETRIARDTADLNTIYQKLKEFSPFTDDPSLRNIITGVVGAKTVNVHQLFSLGAKLVNKMNGQEVFFYSTKRSDKAKTLSSANHIKIPGEDKSIDPALFFQRMMVMSNAGHVSLEEVSKYDLNTFPPSLFDAPSIPKTPDKPSLANAIRQYVQSKDKNAVLNYKVKTDHNVLDGGSLLNRLTWVWKKGKTYQEIATSYAKFAKDNYKYPLVVLDGYDEAPSTKDSTHDKRRASHCPTVNLTPQSEFVGKREEFFSNENNKKKIVDLVAGNMKALDVAVMKCKGDADLSIALEAISLAKNNRTTLIGEDTDLLILLLYHCAVGMPADRLFFRSDKEIASGNYTYDIGKCKAVLGEEFCQCLLFIHAFTGCDTVSRINGIGKPTAFNKLNDMLALRKIAKMFSSEEVSASDIERYGNEAMVLLFGGNTSKTSLNNLRYLTLVDKVTTAKSFVNPERLPPTESATRYHSLRTYYQIRDWQGANNLQATEWGWKQVENKFQMIMTDMLPAPPELLKIIHCNCKTGCETLKCTCRKNGLPCSPACGPCQTDNCYNVSDVTENDLDDSEELS